MEAVKTKEGDLELVKLNMPEQVAHLNPEEQEKVKRILAEYCREQEREEAAVQTEKSGNINCQCSCKEILETVSVKMDKLLSMMVLLQGKDKEKGNVGQVRSDSFLPASPTASPPRLSFSPADPLDLITSSVLPNVSFPLPKLSNLSTPVCTSIVVPTPFTADTNPSTEPLNTPTPLPSSSQTLPTLCSNEISSNRSNSFEYSVLAPPNLPSLFYPPHTQLHCLKKKLPFLLTQIVLYLKTRLKRVHQW